MTPTYQVIDTNKVKLADTLNDAWEKGYEVVQIFKGNEGELDEQTWYTVVLMKRGQR